MKRQFLDVQLQTYTDLAANTICLTPRCVCWARDKRNESKRQRVALRVGPGARRRVQVPRYVAQSESLLPVAQFADLVEVPLRYKVCEFPLGWYRTHMPQCSTSRLVPIVHEHIQAGLSCVGKFLKDLQVSYEEYWGDVGLPRDLQQLHASSAQSFDFNKLLSSKPEPLAVDAFASLAEQLRPKLEQLALPSPAIFPYVPQSWPGSKEIGRQYRVLCRILRENKRRADWHTVTGLLVEPVLRSDLLHHCLSKMFAAASVEATPFFLRMLSHRVQRCLQWRARSFQLLPTSVCNPGYLSARNISGRKRGVQARQSALVVGGGVSVGRFATVTTKPFLGRLVYICSELTEPFPRAIVSSFALEQSLHCYSWNGRATHCWNAAMILLFASSMQSASSGCERIGSQLHHAENGESRIHAGRLLNI